MDRTRAIVIYALIVTLMVALPVLMAIPIPAESKDLVNVVLGFFIAKGGDAIGYLLNTTASGKARADKAETIMTAAAASAVSPPPPTEPATTAAATPA